MKKLIFILSLTLLLTSYGQSHALVKQENAEILSVSPSILNVELSPGKNYNYKIKVKNLTNQTLPLLVSFENFESAGENGGYIFNKTESTFNSITPWLDADKRELLLDPKQETEVNLSVKIPDKINLGGYYGIMFLESALQNEKIQTQVATKVGVLILGNIGIQAPNESSAEIINFNYDNLINQGSQIPLSFRVANRTLNHFSAKPWLTVKNIFGQQKKYEFEEQFIFPGKIRHWNKTINLDSLLTGIYFARLNVSIGNGIIIHKDNLLIAFPVENALIILVITGLILIIVKKRKLLHKVIKILLLNKY
jgi:hypothetical protein